MRPRPGHIGTVTVCYQPIILAQIHGVNRRCNGAPILSVQNSGAGYVRRVVSHARADGPGGGSRLHIDPVLGTVTRFGRADFGMSAMNAAKRDVGVLAPCGVLLLLGRSSSTRRFKNEGRASGFHRGPCSCVRLGAARGHDALSANEYWE